jgi:hypothetical protein
MVLFPSFQKHGVLHTTALHRASDVVACKRTGKAPSVLYSKVKLEDQEDTYTLDFWV